MNKSVIIYEGHTRRKQHVAKTLRQSLTLAEKTIWGFLKQIVSTGSIFGVSIL